MASAAPLGTTLFPMSTYSHKERPSLQLLEGLAPIRMTSSQLLYIVVHQPYLYVHSTRLKVAMISHELPSFQLAFVPPAPSPNSSVLSKKVTRCILCLKVYALLKLYCSTPPSPYKDKMDQLLHFFLDILNSFDTKLPQIPQIPQLCSIQQNWKQSLPDISIEEIVTSYFLSMVPHGSTEVFPATLQASLTQENAVFLSHLCMSTEASQACANYFDCSTAMVIEAVQAPLSFLDAASDLPITSSQQSVNKYKWLLEESKIKRDASSEVTQIDKYMHTVPYITGNLTESIHSMTKLQHVFFNSYSKGPSVAFGEVGINSGAVALFRALMDSLLLARNLTQEVISVFEATLSTERSSIELNQAIEGLSIADLDSVDMYPISMKTLEDIKQAVTSISLDDTTKDFMTSPPIKTLCAIMGIADTFVQYLACLSCLAFQLIRQKAFKSIMGARKKTKGRYRISPQMERFKCLIVDLLGGDASSVDIGANLVERIGNRLLDGRILEYSAALTELISVSNQGTRRPKVPKGTQDYTPQRMAVRDYVIETISKVFRLHGAVQIDTPVFELKETLTGKYGEDQKLIYDLMDQGGEQLSLRYDLTVPFARYVASHSIDKIKRFQIGKVYRRDEPQMQRGRFREFYQCDLDITGHYEPMVPDAEILCVFIEVLQKFEPLLGPICVKVNHRVLLDEIMKACGVPESRLRLICSAIDKLDKEPWMAVRREMVDVKGISEAVADRLGQYVMMKGPARSVLLQLQSQKALSEIERAEGALKELATLCDYLETLGVLEYIRLDLSLARGLDYYTGVIYEAVLAESEQSSSIGGGGRYDSLIGMFSSKPLPAVGVSLGVERLFAALERHFGIASSSLPNTSMKAAGDSQTNTLTAAPSLTIRDSITDILVCSVGNNLLEHRMSLCKWLWANGFACEFLYSANPKLKKQLDYASEKGIQLVVIIGEDELQKGTVQLKALQHPRVGSSSSSVSVDDTLVNKQIPRDTLVQELQAYFGSHPKSFEAIANLFG